MDCTVHCPKEMPVPTSWIPLLVPKDDYMELARIVARRIEARDESAPLAEMSVSSDLDLQPSAGSKSDIASVTLMALRPWELSDLRRLASSEVPTAQRWARALDVCCDHVEVFLSTQQVATEAGMSINEWRDAPRKMTRHLKAHYPDVPAWPLAVKDGRILGHAGDQVYWAVNKEQANRWRQVRKES